MSARPWTATWLSPLALSNTALLWATLIGAFSTAVLVPGTAGIGHVTGSWLVVVAASQGAFALVIMSVRKVVTHPKPATVFVTLALSGAIRGLVIAMGSGLIGMNVITVASVVGRTLNSVVISVIGVALIGATLTWRADFRAQYRILRDRALLLGAEPRESELIDPSVLRAWTTMKGDLDTTLALASERLAAGATQRDLQQASMILTRAIDMNLRPTTHAMWQEAIPAEEPIRLRALLFDTISQWRLPLREILGFLTIVVGIGSVVRSGLVDGGAYTLRYILVTGLVLWLSTSLAQAFTKFAPLVAVTTLALLPPIVLMSDYEIGDVLLGLPEDPTGQIIVALQTPVTTVLIAMAVGAVRDRQQVLSTLQSRIDAEVAALQSRDGRSRRDAQRLSLFVHHSVQSELSALAMQVTEAASTDDAATMEAVRVSTLERLAGLHALDPHAPPWLRPVDGREHIATVVQAWAGILDIATDLPDEADCRPEQWHLAAQVIEEGLANAARHGGAARVAIDGRLDGGCLTLRLVDDGVDGPGTRQSIPGLGTQWLDRIAQGQWSLEQTATGSTLIVRIT